MNRRRLILLPALVLLVLTSVAHADDKKSGVTFGYGLLHQKRLGEQSKGHLVNIGAILNTEKLMVHAGFQFAIDYEYKDGTQYSLFAVAAYKLGWRFFGLYLGGGYKMSLDGYPEPSWSPFDLGAALGLYINAGPVFIGMDWRGWLGFNIYSVREGSRREGGVKIEPYQEAQIYLGIMFK